MTVEIDKYRVVSVAYKEDASNRYIVDLSNGIDWINIVIEFKKRKYYEGYYILSTTEISTAGNTLTYEVKKKLRDKVLFFLKCAMNREY